jgi:hypothetical protein
MLLVLVLFGFDGSTQWVSLHTDPVINGASELTGFGLGWKQSGVVKFLADGARRVAIA